MSEVEGVELETSVSDRTEWSAKAAEDKTFMVRPSEMFALLNDIARLQSALQSRDDRIRELEAEGDAYMIPRLCEEISIPMVHTVFDFKNAFAEARRTAKAEAFEEAAEIASQEVIFVEAGPVGGAMIKCANAIRDALRTKASQTREEKDHG